jgi:hypothetical protein
MGLLETSISPTKTWILKLAGNNSEKVDKEALYAMHQVKAQ